MKKRARQPHLFHRNRSREEVLEIILIALAIIMFWRGVWGLMDLYLFPNHPWFSFLVSVALGLEILIVMRYTSKLID